jgi:GH35 family endo-1,4-beta-xylanase
MTRWLGKPVFFLFAVGVWLLAAGAANALAAAENALVIEAATARIHTEGRAAGNEWNLFSNGDVGDYVQFAQGSRYEVVVRARGSAAGFQWPIAAIKLDGDIRRTFTVARPDFGDYRETIELEPGLHAVAVAFTNDAVIGGEDRNLYLERITLRGVAGQTAPRLGDPTQWTSAGEKREQEALARAAETAETIRKGDAVVEVRDTAGRAVADASVSVEQVRHDFLFGCNIYMFDRYPTEKENTEYKRRFADLFNYATTGFYWRWYEPERGKPMYDYTDRVVTWCRERGIRIKGHPLLWGDKAGIPRWFDGQPSAELRKKRVEDIMTRYRGKIEFWEVVNEPSHQAQPKVEECYPWARETDPSATLIINDYHVLADGCPQFVRLLKNAVAQSVPFDGIGIQAHEPRTMRFPLERCWRILDQYATFGKSLHITEYTPTSAGDPITGSWKQGKWDEAAQAEWAEKFYRLCFGHPAVVAITWWDLCDRGSWLKGGGMLRADLSPKPVYDTLHRLIHEEWHTKASGKTDQSGAFHFRGYCGLYRVTAKTPAGRETQVEFHLTKARRNRMILNLGSSSGKP